MTTAADIALVQESIASAVNKRNPIDFDTANTEFPDTSVVCRTCFSLMDGVKGCRNVLWVDCQECYEAAVASEAVHTEPATTVDRILATLRGEL